MTKGKFFLLLIVAFIAALYIPQTRAQILPYLAPMANPAYKWMTNQEMNQIVQDLQRIEETRGEFPVRQLDFEQWLNSRYPQESSRVDAWGTGYRLQAAGQTFQVISAGPDREFGTDDDLTKDGTRGPRR